MMPKSNPIVAPKGFKSRRLKARLMATLAAMFLFGAGTSTISHAQTPYYQGKTITLVVGTVAGDLYDLYARAFAQHMPKHIPGSPNMIVQNMPGAGHMIAANYLYSVAKPDGLTMGATLPTLYFEQLIGRAEVKFDFSKFTWLGNATKSPQVLYMRTDAPYKSIEDIRIAKEAPKCGTTGTSNMGYFVPKLLEETVGAKFNVIAGYPGGSEVDLAVEKGEVQCRSLSSEAFFSREPFFTWRKNNFVRVLMHGAKNSDERLPGVPSIYELMDKYKTAESGRRLATALMAAGEFHRPYLAPPNLRPEHVKTLREAFLKTAKDPAFLEETKKKKLDLDPSSGEEVETLVKEVMSQPADVVERLKKLMGR